MSPNAREFLALRENTKGELIDEVSNIQVDMYAPRNISRIFSLH